MRCENIVDEIGASGKKDYGEVPASRMSTPACRKCGGYTHVVNKRIYCDRCGYQDGDR